MPIFVSEDEKGQTGKISPGKVIAWFWMLAAMYVTIAYFGIVPWTPPIAHTFWQWLIASFVLGIMSAGFYWGLAKSGFETLVEAMKTRIAGE